MDKLSIKEVRKILNNENISDEKILEIRDDLYELAEIAIKNYIKNKETYRNECY